MKKFFAELVGTFILVLFGCGTAVVAGDKVGILGIAFAFGLALIGAAYGIGPISGCHINPAVSLGVFVAGGIGTVEYLQVLSTHAHLSGPFWDWLNGLDFELLGYAIVAAFIAFWIASMIWYKFRRIDQRYGMSVNAPGAVAVAGPTLALGSGSPP